MFNANLNILHSLVIASRHRLPKPGATLDPNFQPIREFAARRGKRIKAALDARKKARQRQAEQTVVGKKKWVPKHLLVDKTTLKIGPRRYCDTNLKPYPPDNVFFTWLYRKVAYPFEEAIAMHRETHHPTIFNEPNALVEATVELDTRLKKKNKFVDTFSGVLEYPHGLQMKRDRRVVAICKKPEDQELATAAGASVVGGADVIRMIEKGRLTSEDFDHVVCHGDMLIDLAAVRGILKKNFPNKVKGNYGYDMVKLVNKFKDGIDYNCIRDEYELDYAWVEVPFGRLDMPLEQLNENFKFLLQEINKFKPTGAPGPFITRVLVKSLPSKEKLRIKHWEILDGYENPDLALVKKEGQQEEEVEEEVQQATESAGRG